MNLVHDDMFFHKLDIILVLIIPANLTNSISNVLSLIRYMQNTSNETAYLKSLNTNIEHPLYNSLEKG